MTTRSHCGTVLRLTPRNSGTSVWTASSWPGTMRLAYAICGSITGRPWTVRAAAARRSEWRNGAIAGVNSSPAYAYSSRK